MALAGLNPDATYPVEHIDDARDKTVKTTTGQALMSPTELRLLCARDVPVMFDGLPAYGLYCRHVNDLTLSNVQLLYAEGYWRLVNCDRALSS